MNVVFAEQLDLSENQAEGMRSERAHAFKQDADDNLSAEFVGLAGSKGVQ